MVMQQARSRTAESDAAWIAMVEEQAESAPGTYLQEGDVLGRGADDESVPATMRVSSLQYRGYVKVWDTRTGMESLQPWWLLWQTMRKRHDDGTLAFTRTDPHIPPDYGDDLFCPLHPDAPDDYRFAGRGYKSCKKRHIPGENAQQRHLKKSHPQAWEAIERDRHDRERNEDRALQRESNETMRGYMEMISRAMLAQVTVPEAPAATARSSRRTAQTEPDPE